MLTTEQLWLKYEKNLLLFIKKRINQATDAEDILQNTFEKIHTRIDSLKDTTKIESWLYQITRNTIIDFYRSKKPVNDLPDWLLVDEPTDAVNEAKAELICCLAPMINNLPDKYKDAVLMSEINGYNQQEIAERQNISLSGAKSRVQRGRQLLKGLLHECCELEFNKKNELLSVNRKTKK